MRSQQHPIAPGARLVLGFCLLAGLMPGLPAAGPVLAEAGLRPTGAANRPAYGRPSAHWHKRPVTRPALARTPAADGSLAAFVVRVAGGPAGEIRGVYVAGTLALKVVQQPEGAPFYVDMRPGYATQYGRASRAGVTGLLADNQASGVLFYGLEPGQVVSLVYGDGTTRRFRIMATHSFQANDPGNPYSDFVDPVSGRRFSSAELFEHVYSGTGRLVLQTCLAAAGVPAWGRLFIVATPIG